MRLRMWREDRRVVAVLGFLHGVVHANILSIPVFLLAWKTEFGADDVTLGLLAAVGFGFYGLGAVPFGFLADRRPPAASCSCVRPGLRFPWSASRRALPFRSSRSL